MNAPLAGRPLVLLADDDPASRLLTESALDGAGFEVRSAADGHAALAELEHCTPALVLLDVEMPGLDGFAACAAIRASGRHRDVPIVMLTGHDDAESVDRAYALGATDFISKPIIWATLPHRLRHLIAAAAHLGALRASEQRNRALLAALPDRTYVVDRHGIVIEDLGRAEGAAGFTGCRLEQVLSVDGARQAREVLHATLATRVPQSLEHEESADGRAFESRMVPHGEDAVLVIVRDITNRRRSEARIQHLAYFDQLTGLPNRQQFVRELRRAIRQTRRSDRHVAVLYIDLDQFKRINDTLGHSVGDALLKSVGARLESSVRASDFVARVLPADGQAVHFARLGGDEFVALITGARSHEEVDGVATRILETLGAPFRYEEHQLVVTPSIGVAIYPEHGRAVEDLLMHADAAMYQAKAAGRNRRCFYSSTMTARSLERLELENDLRVALAGGALQLYYQPKVAVASGRIHGVEALLRWHHPARGWIAPSQFIPLAEETGLITRLGEFVLERACRQVRAWELGGLGVPHVAVNVSSQQFAQGAICDVALRKVWEAGIRPEAIQLEITETLMLQDVDENIGILRRLREAGFSLAVDDFGTGYSSLSYLKKFPIDALKIDRSFVCNLHTDHDDAAICAAILAMAHELGLEVVAEGVENEEQLDFLRSHHCDVVQGYLTGVPLPADEVEQAIRAVATRRLPSVGAA
ncbi:MAG: EAL domain-containing protein [Steroidobacteraceae bacterium]